MDDAFFLTAHVRKKFLNYVWVRLLTAAYRAKRPHAKEVLFDALSLLSRGGGGEKNLEGMREVAVHGTKSLHTREDNIMLVVNGWIP